MAYTTTTTTDYQKQHNSWTLMEESKKKLTKFLQIVQNPNLNIAKGIASI